MTNPSPAPRTRSRAYDALRLVVLAPAVALALLTVLPTQGSASAAGQGSALASSTTPSVTSSATPTSTAPTTPVATTSPTATSSATTSPTPASTAGSTATSSPASPTPASTSSPSLSPTPSGTASPAGPVPAATATALPSPSPSPTPGPTPSGTATTAPSTLPLTTDHIVIAQLASAPSTATYLAVDTGATGAADFQTFRVGFGLANAGATDQTLTPQLEYRVAGTTAYHPVPVEATVGVPVHLKREWVSDGTTGTVLGADVADIPATELRACLDATQTAVAGRRAMAANPDDVRTVPGGSCTEEEFTVGLSIDAAYGTTYELRLTDAGIPIDGAATASITLGPTPPVNLSPGQRQGELVADPAPAAYPLASALAVGTTVSVARPLMAAATLIGDGTIHGPYSTNADQCAVCHSAHTSKGPNLLVTSGQSAPLCFMCHDGLGASTNVKAQYALVRPANDATTRAYYSHDAVSPSNHTLTSADEFNGVLNRHSDCSDCHNSHQAQASTPSVELTDPANPTVPTGWSASSELAGVPGVAVTNGAAGTTPTYTYLDGTLQPVTHEYQVCFTCHSSYTILPSAIAGKPSTDATDTAVEFNPNNPSFHPIEAPGTNQTAAMQASLAGTSPYKLWNFSAGGTVRCLNCHASSQTPDTASPGSSLSPHTSANRGILIRNYEDRVLSAAKANYNSGDFALCYVCHAEAPFSNASGGSAATNFTLHGMHLTEIADKGNGGRSIDTPGDGQGNALCAECHFRIHSTADKVGSQQVDGTRLVNFAPDVQPNGGTLSWTPSATGGSCTLTCHGVPHMNERYGG